MCAHSGINLIVKFDPARYQRQTSQFSKQNRHRTGTNFYLLDPLRWTTEPRDIRIDDLKPSAMGEVAFPQRAFIQTFDEVPQDYRRLVVAPVLLVDPGSSFYWRDMGGLPGIISPTFYNWNSWAHLVVDIIDGLCWGRLFFCWGNWNFAKNDLKTRILFQYT